MRKGHTLYSKPLLKSHKINNEYALIKDFDFITVELYPNNDNLYANTHYHIENRDYSNYRFIVWCPQALFIKSI